MVARDLQTEPLFTEAEYLAFERAAEERHEYIDGVIRAMAGESNEHGDISVNLVRIISTRLLRKPCHTYTKDTKVRSGPLPKFRQRPKGLFSYPDLVVVCGERKYLDQYQDVLLNPTVIVEVLSDRTEFIDRRQKFLRYQKYLPSLVDYVLVSQNEPAIEIFHCDAQGQWTYQSAIGLKARIRIASIECELRLRDVYYRVEFPAEETATSATRNPTTGRKLTKQAKARKTARPARAKK